MRRAGLHTEIRKLWAVKGSRPVVLCQIKSVTGGQARSLQGVPESFRKPARNPASEMKFIGEAEMVSDLVDSQVRADKVMDSLQVDPPLQNSA